MRFTLLLIAVLPLVLGAKELLGEELPSKESPSDDVGNSVDANDLPEDDTMIVKRSVNDIAARRRSALDKNFMRFGRSAPMSMRLGRGQNNGFIRFGRGRNQNVMRFGRASGNVMRFGRSPNNFMRFGRAGNNLMRFGRGGNNLMRFGRGGNNLMRLGRANNLMRFGRGGGNLMRFGRTVDADYEPYKNLMGLAGSDDDDFLNNGLDGFEGDDDNADDAINYDPDNIDDDDLRRLGRSLNKNDPKNKLNGQNEEPSSVNNMNQKNANKKNPMYYDDGFMRLGRITTDNPIENMSEENAFDLLFPDETRRKRSLDNNNRVPKNKSANKDVESNVETTDRTASSEKPVSCQS